MAFHLIIKQSNMGAFLVVYVFIYFWLCSNGGSNQIAGA